MGNKSSKHPIIHSNQKRYSLIQKVLWSANLVDDTITIILHYAKEHKILIAGGYNADTHTACRSVLIYDPIYDAWKEIFITSSPKQQQQPQHENSNVIIDYKYTAQYDRDYELSFNPYNLVLESTTAQLPPPVIHDHGYRGMITSLPELFISHGVLGDCCYCTLPFRLNEDKRIEYKKTSKTNNKEEEEDWIQCNPPPPTYNRQKMGKAMTNCQNILYVCGGGGRNDDDSAACFSFTIGELDWKRIAYLNISRSFAMTCCLDNDVFIYGGYRNSFKEQLISAERYTTNKTWQLIQPMPSFRDYAVALVV